VTKVGNVLPMVEVADTAAARAGDALPPRAWAMLDLARAAGHAGARLTWCAGWTSVLREDSAKPRTAAGRPGRSTVDVVTQSLVLRVPGLLWVAWERPDGADDWGTPGVKMQGQVRVAAADGGGVRACTCAAAERLLRTRAKELVDRGAPLSPDGRAVRHDAGRAAAPTPRRDVRDVQHQGRPVGHQSEATGGCAVIVERAWSELTVGDGVLGRDGAWRRVTRAESGWVEVDGATAFPVPAGRVTSWDSMAAATALVATTLGGSEVAQD